MADDTRAPAGIGCLGTLLGLVALAAIVVLVFFVGFLALAVVAALVVVGLVALAVDRVLLALSPKRRARREAQRRMSAWRFGTSVPGGVIDTTATDTTGHGEVPPSDGPGPGELDA